MPTRSKLRTEYLNPVWRPAKQPKAPIGGRKFRSAERGPKESAHSLWATSDHGCKPAVHPGGLPLPKLRLEQLKDGPVNSWRAVTLRETQNGSSFAPGTAGPDLWNEPAWSTTHREMDNTGPFGVDGPYGPDGPEPAFLVNQREIQERQKELQKLERQRGGPATVRDTRQPNYTSIARGSWSWPEHMQPRMPMGSSRLFQSHPAVRGVVPHKSLHAMGAYHGDPTYHLQSTRAM